MSSLSGCCERLARLDSHTPAVWGSMNAHQMVCHLNDSFRVATGEKHASPATNILQRSVIKWLALHMPMKWPRGVPTRPEIEQGKGGTPPAAWDRDVAELTTLILSFSGQKTFGIHPMFGEMNRDEWMIWAYRHVDQHFRQFGV
ncbi:MAG TPA: DUF1569 domain-containing protein [Bryobacteraceae bacterium]|jgi:hypothetical protein|nr:DUF1569 domain-containing protein [Bryobacteraceae bacterium]